MSVSEIVSAYKTVTAPDSTTDAVWVKEYAKPEATDEHQFLFFLKPEATSANVEVILDLALKVLTDNGVSFGAIRVVGGPYLEKHDIMIQHYGVISQIYKNGYSVISDQAKAKLESDFSAEVAAAGNPIGGYEFLQAHPEFNPLSLSILSDNVGCARLAGGTYLLKVKYLGETILILNPFHGYQLVPFVSKGSALIVFEGRSKTSWEDLRGKLCGATDPAAAEAGSIRNELLLNKEKTGMAAVDKGSNGVHMSAGPLEGLVELQRFFSDHEKGSLLKFTDLSFGSNLVDLGLSEDQVNHLATNPDVSHDGKNISVFDLTEEKNADESAKLLKTVL
jgi:hypothetical protein